MKNLCYLLALFLLIGTGCEDDAPEAFNEQEVITTVIYTLISTDNDTVIMKYQDLDPTDTIDATVSITGSLDTNKMYAGNIQILDESENSAEDITTEIAEEDEEHQLFFVTGGGLDMTFEYNDTDEDGNPIGLSTKVTTNNASTGTLTITLIHEPNKTAAGISIGNPGVAGGEEDVQVAFDLRIVN